MVYKINKLNEHCELYLPYHLTEITYTHTVCMYMICELSLCILILFLDWRFARTHTVNRVQDYTA